MLITYFLKVHFHNFLKIKKSQNSRNQCTYFLLFLLDDGRIWIRSRIRTYDLRIRIREIQHTYEYYEKIVTCSFRNLTIKCLVASSIIYGLVTYQYLSKQKITTFFLFASAYINGRIRNWAGFRSGKKRGFLRIRDTTLKIKFPKHCWETHSSYRGSYCSKKRTITFKLINNSQGDGTCDLTNLHESG